MQLQDEPAFEERVNEVLASLGSDLQTASEELWRIGCLPLLAAQLGADFLNATNPWCVIQVVTWLACEPLLSITNARGPVQLNPARLRLSSVDLQPCVREGEFLQQPCQTGSYPFIWAGFRERFGNREVGYSSLTYAYGAEDPHGCWLSPMRSHGAFSSADDRRPRVWHHEHQGAFVEVSGDLKDGRLTPQQVKLYPFGTGCIYAAAALDSQGH